MRLPVAVKIAFAMAGAIAVCWLRDAARRICARHEIGLDDGISSMRSGS